MRNDSRSGNMYLTEKRQPNEVPNFWVTPGHMINHREVLWCLCFFSARFTDVSGAPKCILYLHVTNI